MHHLKRRSISIVVMLASIAVLVIAIHSSIYAMEEKKKQQLELEREVFYEKQLDRICSCMSDLQEDVSEMEELENAIQKLMESEETQNMYNNLASASEYAVKLESESISQGEEDEQQAVSCLSEVQILVDNVLQRNSDIANQTREMQNLCVVNHEASRKLLQSFKMENIDESSELYERLATIILNVESFWKNSEEKLQEIIDKSEAFEKEILSKQSECDSVFEILSAFENRKEALNYKLSILWDEPREVEMDEDLKGYASVENYNVTAYCACYQCSGNNTLTASGTMPKEYRTMAASKNLPFGTVLYVPALKNTPSNGWYIVEDRGGAIKGNRLDLYMGSHSQALQFGRQTMEVYVFVK